MKASDFGIIGLAVMGENLAMNVESRGFYVSVFNRSIEKTLHFVNGRGAGKHFYGARTLIEFCQSLSRPRKVMLMVKAGDAVDSMIDGLLPLLDSGDIIIDGGNSNYSDTERRCEKLSQSGILYVGSGVSGGEYGALHGPSLMPGGSHRAWPLIKPIFEAITAKVGEDNQPCCTWIGRGGAGHFVKMVHNGIEYGDMQAICEGYDLLSKLLHFGNAEIAETFDRWNSGRLASYLIEITADIFKYRENGEAIVDKILDSAGQKGTGKWTAITALDEGVPLNFITESVYARFISAQKSVREELNVKYLKGVAPMSGDVIAHIDIDVDDIEAALFASKLISYSQGFELITSKSREMGWDIDVSAVAKIWRGGCIIRSAFLDDIALAYRNQSAIDGNADMQSLLFSDFYQRNLPEAMNSLRKVAATASLNAVPVPCIGSALAYYDSITSNSLPANLLQAQRDYFGSHLYERTDKPRGEFYHTDWMAK